MIRKSLVIQNRLGLHARAASLFVKTAASFGAAITVKHQDDSSREANGKSIMSVMVLEATQGTELEIIADGDDAEEALAALESLINDKFGEGE